MSKSTKNTGKLWLQEDIKLLNDLAKGNTPTGIIALKLGRTVDSVRAKAKNINVSLQPPNKSPYNRKPKNS